MKPAIIIRGSSARRDEFNPLKVDFETHYAASAEEYDEVIDKLADRADAVVTNGSIGLSGSQMARLTKLRLVLCRGVGSENVDADQARSRGIVVTNGAGVNWFAVADQAMTLLLGVVRDAVNMNRLTRTGGWAKARATYQPTLYRKALGIVGMGRIGEGIMRRATGFDMDIAYTSRTQRQALMCSFVPNVQALAERSDVLMICTPGGPETKHLINADVLKALGPGGYLVNVARGTVVDTTALVAALQNGTIAGAGLDVWEGEPELPDNLAAAPNLLLSPHIGGLSAETIAAANDLVSSNLRAFFRGDMVENQIV